MKFHKQIKAEVNTKNGWLKSTDIDEIYIFYFFSAAMHYRGVSGVYSEATLQMFEGGSTSTSTSTSTADWEGPSTLLPPRPVSASCGGFRLCKKCPNHVGPLVT